MTRDNFETEIYKALIACQVWEERYRDSCGVEALKRIQAVMKKDNQLFNLLNLKREEDYDSTRK